MSDAMAREITFAAYCSCGWEHHCSEPFVAAVHASQHLREAHATVADFVAGGVS